MLLQMGQKSKQSGGLLDAQDKIENLYPLLEYSFRESPYLEDAQMLGIIFKYAGVKDLIEFGKNYAPTPTACNFIHPKELNDLAKESGALSFVQHQQHSVT